MPSTPEVSFVHLRTHTEFSVSDGTMRIDEMVAAAREDGQGALAITDANNIFAAIKFYRKARSAGIKPIIGADCCISVPGDEVTYRMVLLASNRQGYLRLCDLLTRSWVEGIKGEVPHVSIDWLQNETDLICLCGFSEGLVGKSLLKGEEECASVWASSLMSKFGDSFCMEVQRHSPEAIALTEKQVALAEAMGVPLVATHPVQFLARGGYRAHEARTCVATAALLDDEKRVVRFFEDQYFKTQDEMLALFADLPTAISNTLEVAKRCSLTIDLGKPQLPNFPTPGNVPLDQYLRDQAMEGLSSRMEVIYPDPVDRWSALDRYETRLKWECDTIIQMGFPGYFLIVADFIGWSKKNGVPVGPGRGSGAGSLVAYSLGITDINPLDYDLLFERFLNPERVSMPDFDIDFCQDGRERVIEYVRGKYGEGSVSQIATFGTMGAKAVIRDAGRVLALPYGLCDSLSKLIPSTPTDPWDLKRAKSEEPAFAQKLDEDDGAARLYDLAVQMEGLTRSVGTHAGGVLIAPGKLTDFCPLYRAPGTTTSVSQFDKDDVESVGLVKFDFLGLRNLTIIDLAVRTIKDRHKDMSNFSIELLKLDDPEVFKVFGDGNTTAVFQSESRSAKDLEVKLQPDCFEDIIALMALNRPGPLGSGMVDDFIKRKIAVRKTGVADPEWYFHPSLEGILKPTYGVIVYQEQVMLVAQILAGYTLGGADLLRRAMGKKKPEEMAKQRQIFTDGATARGVQPDLATHLFDLMEKFAEYGFNKSHSAAYALIAYQTAWLKRYYPAEFMAATLSCDMDDTDKVKIFCEDVWASGMKILPPCVNHSTYQFQAVDASTIRYGLGAVKGVGAAVIELIQDARGSVGGFSSLYDFFSRFGKKKLGKRVLEQLTRSGALDCFGVERGRLFASIPLLTEWAVAREKVSGQATLLSGDALEPPELVACDPWTASEQLSAEKQALGQFFSGNVFTPYAAELRRYAPTKIEALKISRSEQRIAGAVTSVRARTTKKGKMVVLAIDDGTAPLEIALFDAALMDAALALKEDRMVVIAGRAGEDRMKGGLRFMPNRILTLADARSEWAHLLTITLKPDQSIKSVMELLHPLLRHSSQPGIPVRVVEQAADGSGEIYTDIVTDVGARHIYPDELFMKLLSGFSFSVS